MRAKLKTEVYAVENKKRYSDMELKRIAGKLGISCDRITGVVPFICDEDGNEYEVWSVETADTRYVLKRTKGLETECYSVFFREKKRWSWQ